MRSYLKRVGDLIIGIVLFSAGIVLTMKANLGYAPWEVFHQGLGERISLSIGNASILTSFVICIIVVLMGEKLGFGTILNMVLMGVFIDGLLLLDFIPQMQGLLSGILEITIGFFIIAFGSYFYIRSGFGAGPRDSLMVAFERKSNLSVGLCRIIIESSAVLIGWIFGGPVGIGTVIAAFGIGLCVQIVFTLMKFKATDVKHETLDITYRNIKSLIYRKDIG
ncbi:MAG: hypothetical protein HGA27_03095 [Peptococcaceae bacterium]|nr:hypothetical protein [Peptococcaceae bacterium]